LSNAPIINIIGTRCRPEVEETFNKWYDEVHIPMLLRFKGLKKVTRYKTAEPSSEFPTYLAIYEYPDKKSFDEFHASKEFADAMAETKQTWKEGDWEIVWRLPYDGIKAWEQ